MIPLNLYLIHMPECVSIVISAFIILLNAILWLKDKTNRAAKAFLSFLSIVAILVSLFGAYCNPYWNSLALRGNANTLVKADDMVLTRAEALTDLDDAVKYLRKLHPALYRGMTEDIENQYQLARQTIENCEKIDICTLSQEIEAVFALLNDAHTHADAWYNDYHYLKYIYEHNEAGDSVIRINGIALDELFQRNAHLISFESRAYGMTKIYNYISSLEGLRYLGIPVEDGAEYPYEDATGNESSYTFAKKDFVTYDEYAAFNGIEEDAEEGHPFVRYEIDAENDVAILPLDSCINNTEYRECLNEMFRAIKENGIHNVAM